MVLSIDNVAIIRHAQININNICVIAGYNGTGKSTISKSLYAIIESKNDIAKKILDERGRSLRFRLNNYFKMLDNWINYFPFIDTICDYIRDSKFVGINREAITTFLEKLSSSTEENELSFDNEMINQIIKCVNEIMEKTDSEYVDFIAESTLKSIFNNQINYFGDMSLVPSIELDDGKTTHLISYEDEHFLNSNHNTTSINNVIYLETKHLLDYYNAFSKRRFAFRTSSCDDKIFKLLEDDETDKLSLEEKIERDKSLDIINTIISDVTKGKMILDKNQLLYQEEDFDTPLMLSNVASGLKSFLVLQKLIENSVLTSDDFLIIDEPETNLHPEWQLIFAEILVLLSDKLKIKILINSHSPYFIRAIEVNMGKYSLADKSNYYLLTKNEVGTFDAVDVTKKTELIYKDLYKPLDFLN